MEKLVASCHQCEYNRWYYGKCLRGKKERYNNCDEFSCVGILVGDDWKKRWVTFTEPGYHENKGYLYFSLTEKEARELAEYLKRLGIASKAKIAFIVDEVKNEL
jgi:hypothetical protein